VYDSEVVDALPANDHDQLVHAALTPTQLIVLGEDSGRRADC
jgi:5-formyltetrahydrofolate cyclo-ligase